MADRAPSTLELSKQKIKNQFVRCGVRTHALFRVSELKSDALDRSANLTML